jgi:phosphoglycolate phosphatase
MPIPPLALVLDLDGTLVDSLPDIRASLSLQLEAVGRRPVSLDETRLMLGDGAELLVQRALALTGEQGSERQRRDFLQRFLAHYEAHAAVTTRCFPGVEHTLDLLRRGGHRLGVCSNKPHGASVALLRRLGLEDRLHAALGGDAVAQKKPHPAHLWATVRAMGAEGLPVVMVGDSAPDAEVAHRAGVPFVAASYGYHRGETIDELEADAVIHRFDALPEVLERLHRRWASAR